MDQCNFCPVCGQKTTAQNSRFYLCPKGHHLYIKPVPCNAAIFENKQGQILLIKRKYDPGKDKFDLPGGFIEPNETIEESLVREIKEELGIKIQDYEYLGSYFDRYLFKGMNYYTLAAVFACKLKKEVVQALDDVGEIVFVDKKKLPFGKFAFESIEKAIRDYLDSQQKI